MGFQTALSGLTAATGNLNVTGHNIANASTTGFKRSRAEFADVYAVSFGGVARNATGSGVRLANVAQQFAQGNVDFTDNNLDLAISGEGFFALKDNGADVYSRAGNFTVNRDGYVVNAFDQRLQVYDVDQVTGTVTNFSPSDLQLNLGANPARATSNVNLNLNLDAAATVQTVKPIDVNDPASYSFSTTTSVYDSLGATHDASFYFQKATATTELGFTGMVTNSAGPYPAAALPPVMTTIYDSLGGSYTASVTFRQQGPLATDWEADISLNGGPIQTATIDLATTPPTVGNNTFLAVDLDGAGAGLPADMTFDFSGLTLGASTTATVTTRRDDGPSGIWNVLMSIDGQLFDQEVIAFNTNGSLATTPPALSFNDGTSPFNPANGDPMSITVDFTGSTQFGDTSAVNNLIQDGYTVGRLSGVSVDGNGVVFARYTNGQAESLGAVALVRFNNPNGLQQLGDTNWAESFESGDAQAGQAGTGTFGAIQSGALEASNVDISKQLVNMIIAQRDFQANAKMISTEDSVTQTIINIR